MDKDFVFCSMIWGTVIVLVIAAITTGFIIAGNYDHNFDKTCIAAGKNIEYKTVEGSSSYWKECK